MAKLIVLNQGLTGLSHEVGMNWTVIGRANGTAFQVVEVSVSGRHCEVQLRGSDLFVRDLKSTNGTYIDGRKITEGVVKPGQTLRLGNVDLRYELVASAPASAPAAAAPATPAVPKVSAAPVVPAPAPAAAKAAVPVVPVVPAVPATPAATPVQAVPAPAVAPARPAPVAAEAPKKHGDLSSLPKPPPLAETGPEPERKFHVLLVDDSDAFLETFSEYCLSMAGRSWKIHRASSADQALSILAHNTIDLAVLDIAMPMVDGIQLLSIINRRYSGMKIAVMTGHATESNRTACLSGGAELFIEKPVSVEGIKMVFNMLNDLLLWTHREGFSGALRQVGLQELIQLECLGRHSSILEVRNQQSHGQIFIEFGAIVHATFGTLVGEKALFKVLSLPGGEFRLQTFKTPPERTIQGSWEFLLMEAARVRDEENSTQFKKAEKNPAAATVVPANPIGGPPVSAKPSNGGPIARATTPASPAPASAPIVSRSNGSHAPTVIPENPIGFKAASVKESRVEKPITAARSSAPATPATPVPPADPVSPAKQDASTPPEASSAATTPPAGEPRTEAKPPTAASDSNGTDDFVVVAEYDGKWNASDGNKK